MSFLYRPAMYFCRQFVRNSSTTLKSRQTICSLCSAPGKCAVSIIRLSGPDTSIALQKLTNSDKPPAPRMALLRELINPQNGEIIDKGLVYYFPAPKSFTGEDICEFHVHGSTAVVEEMIRVLTSMNNIRQADPGEFLRRAFYNNKFDLLAIEGIHDLINAATEQQRRQAVQVTYGKMRESFDAWRKVLIQCIASIEASIDFSETDNIQKDDHHVHKSILRIRDEMNKYLNEADQAVSIKTGTKVIIYGAPNVGKSSLLNLLCRTNRAIVSEQPGTTRDIIEVPLNLGGYAARLIDTAGIRRKSMDKLEREGINRALDMLVPEPSLGIHILICSAETYFHYMDTHENKQFEDFLLDYMLELGLYDLINPRNKFDSFFKQRTVIIMNKVDIFEGKRQFCLPKQVCLLSCRSKEGYEHFLNELIQQLKIMLPDSRESPRLTTMRQKEYLNYSVMFINKYINQLHAGEEDVVLVEILKKSLKYMNVLTGKLITDDILDAMFSEFCIGK